MLRMMNMAPEEHAHEEASHSSSDLPTGAPADGLYVCPMHPEVRSSAPGRCPKCGMALEQRDET
jgi:rubrerythrin